MALEERLERIELLFQLFCTDHYKTACRYRNQKETEVEPGLWDVYLMKLVDEKAIHFSVVSSYANYLVKS